ncbi:hypothetical protein SAMN03159376_01228 [Pseudomonas sp. NFACC09-4]|uniref:hypothetical protein n=1 Tax=Pseudomonas TaxID=286 RepID=UPI000908A9A2|nr:MULTISPECIES: hypothetical protein [Pseudomonas]MDT8908527.1 hypothetical protein [Pseudomonas prosekii]NHN71275.1 hypothetical protein [Pseudomonas fluorescens]ROO41616.1 hypothetical protein BIV08_12160 [Pseudomonas sp. AF76]SFW36867.1 hypothetical protein SAMN03159376_01228 [Pseudomonas sp. NFACC09-4]
MNDDWTDFEDGERNGWENDVGSLDGILKTEEGPNTFWSGKLEWRPPYIFQPSLAKMFTLPGGEQERGFLFTSFKYRVHPPEPGEARETAIVVTANVSLGYAAFPIDGRTQTGKWLDSSPIGVRYSGSRAHVLIGTDFGDGLSRKVDIDEIKVERVPDK